MDGIQALGIGALLAFACAITYAGVLDHDFVSFDDPRYIVGNAHVRLGLTFEGVRWAFTHVYSDNWHPLTWLSHMLDVELFGLRPAGHHAMSVALHAIDAALLFAVFRTATPTPWPSAMAAALFALHPLCVESVAWAAERKDVLSGLFLLLTLLAYARYAARPTVLRFGIVSAAFICGLLAKPMLVTLPLLLLLYDFWCSLGWNRRPASDTPNAIAGISGPAIATHRQVAVWASSERLYQHGLEVTRDNYIAAFNLGALAGEAHAYESALRFYDLALHLRPGYAAAHNNRGVALEQLGERDGEEALELATACNRATEYRNPTFLKTLAFALAEVGDSAEAARVRSRALALTPADARPALQLAFERRIDARDARPGGRE